MKKQVMMLLCLVPLLASAQMNITTNEHVSKEMIPDVLSGSIYFDEEGQNPNTIKEHLNQLVIAVKQFDPKNEFCQGGSYSVSPRYSKEKDKEQELIAYNGKLSFRCNLSSIEQYNVLIAVLEKAKISSVHMDQFPLSWNVSAKTRQDTHLALRSKLLQLGNEQAQVFSKETKMHCEVSSVNFDGRASSQQGMVKSNMMLLESTEISANKSIPTEAPIKKNEELSIDAIVNYTCTNK